MTKRILTLAALLTLAAVSFASAQPASIYRGTMVRPLASAVAVDDTDVMIVIKYVGDQTSAATVTVTSATALIAFLRAGIADTTINTGATCGAVVGTIDGTDADCNTVGEVVDMINASGNWRAMPLDSLRTDATTANIMNTTASCNAKQPAGCPVYRDTNGATIWNFTRALVSCRDASCLWAGLGANTQQNPYKGTYGVLWNWNYRTTYGAGTSVVRIYSVTPSSAGGGETVQILYAGTAAATNTFQALGPTTWPYGLIGLPDSKLVLRVINDNSMSVTEGYAYGALFRY